MADLIVIGAGHAGCEAALCGARMGLDTLLLTLNVESVALMPCNPSIGGTGKGHLVREVDALGGEMGRAADDVTLQNRMLNRGKGPAVHSLRIQADKRAYHMRMLNTLFAQEHLTLRQGEAAEILTKGGRVCGVRTLTGDCIPCRAVVVCTGVYLKSRIIIGEAQWEGAAAPGPDARRGAFGLPGRLGLRPAPALKRARPPGWRKTSIDFEKMEPQPCATSRPRPFLFSPRMRRRRISCPAI